MPRINSIDFYQSRPKIVIYAKKIKEISSIGGSAPHTLRLRCLGALPLDPNCLRWLGDLLPDPHNASPHADFWLRACMKKNLLHIPAGLHLY